MTRLLAILGLLAGLFASGAARADEAVERAKRRELERARAEIGAELQLAAYDLVDELVLGWREQPLFDKPTPVVLTELTVPVGLGTGLQSLVETHLTDVLLQNPETKMELVHCPRCTATVVQSGPEGTVVRRGHDDPKLLEELGQNGNRHALFVDIEAEGSWLVLRARLTRLEPDLPIAWARTISTSSSTPALLREASDLKTAAEAREEYDNALEGRGPITVPLRFTIRSYARPGGQSISAPPFLWFQSGAELATTEARAWVASFLLGYSVVPQAYQGILGQVRVNRLVSGRARSLTRPDLYAFVGGALVSVWGPSTVPFRLRQLTADELLGDANLDNPRAIFATVQVGLDLRLGDRMGIGAFVETMPSLRTSPNFGDYVFFFGLPWQTLGSEVSVCF